MCASAATQQPRAPVSAAAAKQLQAKRAASKAAAAQAKILTLAPADEYFGPLKQSVIGINNTIRTLGWNYDVNHDIGDQTFASAGLTERAILDWEKKYPKDDQLPRSLFLLQRLYTKVLTYTARTHAKFVANWLFKDYGTSPQARQLKKTLALEHLAPLPSPTPVPTAVPSYQSIFGPSYPSQFESTPVPAHTAAPGGTPPAGTAPATPASR
jgi:hypothetical protein